MLVNPNNAGAVQDIPEVALAARGIGLRLQVIPAGTEADIDAAFVKLVREKAQALLVMADGFFTLQRQQIAALAARHALPAVYPWREHVVDGGLVSYGSSIREAYRQSGIYVGQILKGAKAGELPVQQPTKFELVINLKTAKALGIDLPTSLLAARRRGDRMRCARQSWRDPAGARSYAGAAGEVVPVRVLTTISRIGETNGSPHCEHPVRRNG